MEVEGEIEHELKEVVFFLFLLENASRMQPATSSTR